jgi:hypothetical protein
VKPTAAVAVFDSSQVWGKPDRGVQLFGSARAALDAEIPDVERVYRKRFPGTADSSRLPYLFYVLHPRRVKLFDEHELGPGVFVTANLRHGELTWVRTDLYEGREREIELP